MLYNFEWDPAKAKRNLRKHSISFDRAAQVFLDPFAISIYDEKHDDEEERWITLGMDKNNVTLVVIHTFREVDETNYNIRIISARTATQHEARQYQER